MHTKVFLYKQGHINVYVKCQLQSKDTISVCASALQQTPCTPAIVAKEDQ